MRNTLIIVTLLLGMFWAGTARAGEQTTLWVSTHGWCNISSISLDLECCGWCDTSEPVTVELLDYNGEVLGTAVIANWCCDWELTASLDNPVNASQVCSVRISKASDQCCYITWLSVKGFCGDWCCGKWRRLAKGKVCFWPTPEPKPEPVQVAEPPPVWPKPEYVPPPPPEPGPDFDYFPDVQPVEEVIIVEGRG